MANVHDNLLDASLNPLVTTAAVSALNALIAALPPNSLSPEQQSTLLAINVDNYVFARTALTVMIGSGTTVLPAFISFVNLQTDLTLYDDLDTVEERLLVALGRVKDIKRLAGHEAYALATMAYKIYQAAALGGIPEAEEGYELMKVRYEYVTPPGPVPAPMTL